MKNLFILIIFAVTFQINFAQQIISPDGKLTLKFNLVNTNPAYSLSYQNKIVIKESSLGIDLLTEPDFLDGFSVEKFDTITFNETWSPVWGEVSRIINNYKELKVTLSQLIPDKRILVITFRLFNDGLGFRYEFPLQDKLNYFTVKEEYSSFSLTGNHKTFWIPGDYDSQEYTYTTSLLSEIHAGKGANFDDIVTKNLPGDDYVQTPLMMKTSDGVLY